MPRRPSLRLSGSLPDDGSEAGDRRIQQLIQQVAEKTGFELKFYKGSCPSFTIVVQQNLRAVVRKRLTED